MSAPNGCCRPPRKPRCMPTAWGRPWRSRRARKEARRPLVVMPETVAKAMLEYYKLGATSLLIRGYDPQPDAVQYGEELIPRLRELVAAYDSSKKVPS